MRSNVPLAVLAVLWFTSGCEHFRTTHSYLHSVLPMVFWVTFCVCVSAASFDSQDCTLQNNSGLMLYELEALPNHPVHRQTPKGATAAAAKSDQIPAG